MLLFYHVINKNMLSSCIIYGETNDCMQTDKPSQHVTNHLG